MRGWSPFVSHVWTLRGHPQEIAENSVDLGHFTAVHRYPEATLTALEIDGPLLVASYRFERKTTIAGMAFPLRVNFDAQVYGPGYGLVDVRLPALGLRLRQLVLAVPTEKGQIALRVALSSRELRRTGKLGKPLATMITRALFPLVKNDVSQDFAIWKNKRYVERPSLAAGDGPIAQYRKWAAQFYEGETATTSRRALPLLGAEHGEQQESAASLRS
jgi:hypothetical protein